MSFKKFYLVGLLLLCACTNNTTVRQSPNFNKSDLLQSNIAILPAEAMVHTVEFSGKGERMNDYEEHIEDVINERARDLLLSKGYRITLLTEKDVYDQKISPQILELRERYKPELKKLYTPITLPVYKAYNIDSQLGPDAVKFKGFDDKRYILLFDYAHSSKTNGARAAGFMLDVLVGSNMSSEAEKSVITAGIIDQKNGEILWTNNYISVGGIFSSSFSKSVAEAEKKEITQLLENVLRPLLTEDKKK